MICTVRIVTNTMLDYVFAQIYDQLSLDDNIVCHFTDARFSAAAMKHISHCMAAPFNPLTCPFEMDGCFAHPLVLAQQQQHNKNPAANGNVFFSMTVPLLVFQLSSSS